MRRKIEPDQIAGIRHILAGYHSSLPSGAPQSVSVWRFAAVISRMRSLSFEVPFFLRILTVPEPSTDNSRLSPGRSLAASATFLGIRTAMLLPHFATCVFTARTPCRYKANTQGTPRSLRQLDRHAVGGFLAGAQGAFTGDAVEIVAAQAKREIPTGEACAQRSHLAQSPGRKLGDADIPSYKMHKKHLAAAFREGPFHNFAGL